LLGGGLPKLSSEVSFSTSLFKVPALMFSPSRITFPAGSSHILTSLFSSEEFTISLVAELRLIEGEQTGYFPIFKKPQTNEMLLEKIMLVGNWNIFSDSFFQKAIKWICTQ